MKMISASIRDMLIDHLDGRVVPVDVTIRGRAITLFACLERGFIRYDHPPSRYATVITTLGRAALAEALAEWAEALVRAGFDLKVEPEPSLELAFLRQWSESRKPEEVDLGQ